MSQHPSSPASSARIRVATAADAPTLARLRFQFRADLATPVEEESAFVARCTEWMVARLRESDRWQAWVTEDEAGTIVGTLWVSLIEKMPNPTSEPERHAYVTNVYVMPWWRDRGVGSQLLDTALQWCDEQRVHAAILWPSERSVPLYERAGFRVPVRLLERERTESIEATARRTTSTGDPVG